MEQKFYYNDGSYILVNGKDDPYHPENDRLAKLKEGIIELTYEYGIKPIARDFFLEPKTIRDWRKLYDLYGISGLVTKRTRLNIDLLEQCLEKYRK